MQKKQRHLSHGEVNLFEIDNIPTSAKKIDPLKRPELYNNKFFIIAPSESTFNHHLVELTPGVTIWEDTDGTIYIRNENATQVSCVDTKRHDTIELPPSIWKRKPSKEVDHLRQLKRNVAD